MTELEKPSVLSRVNLYGGVAGGWASIGLGSYEFFSGRHIAGVITGVAGVAMAGIGISFDSKSYSIKPEESSIDN